jgi:hypothetical protein
MSPNVTSRVILISNPLQYVLIARCLAIHSSILAILLSFSPHFVSILVILCQPLVLLFNAFVAFTGPAIPYGSRRCRLRRCDSRHRLLSRLPPKALFLTALADYDGSCYFRRVLLFPTAIAISDGYCYFRRHRCLLTASLQLTAIAASHASCCLSRGPPDDASGAFALSYDSLHTTRRY